MQGTAGSVAVLRQIKAIEFRIICNALHVNQELRETKIVSLAGPCVSGP